MFSVTRIVRTPPDRSHLHLQDLLQSLHDYQRRLLDGGVAVLGAVLHDLHQSLIGSRPQVALVTIRSEHKQTSLQSATRYHQPQSLTAGSFSPVRCLQELLDDDFKGRGQAVGAGLLLILRSVGGLVGGFGE